MVSSPRTKWCCSTEWEVQADCPRKPTPQRQREEDHLVGHLGDSHHEAFCKASELVQQIRQTYFFTHALTFHKEDTYELTEVFKKVAEMAGLLGTEVYPVHDQWVGRKELCSAYHVVRGSIKDLHFFSTGVPLESPKIMGLWGIQCLEALKQQEGLSFCLWCGKEGQNERTIINHIHTRHYWLGLICKRCLSYFTTTLDKMRHHAKGCPCTPSHKDSGDREEEKFN